MNPVINKLKTTMILSIVNFCVPTILFIAAICSINYTNNYLTSLSALIVYSCLSTGSIVTFVISIIVCVFLFKLSSQVNKLKGLVLTAAILQIFPLLILWFGFWLFPLELFTSVFLLAIMIFVIVAYVINIKSELVSNGNSMPKKVANAKFAPHHISDKIEAIKRLHELKKSGAITQKEFDVEKSKLLS